MAAGVPVISTRVGGAAEAVEDGVTGLLVAPKEPGALAQGIDRLLSDGELARSYGCAGQRRMTERFGFDAAIQKTERLYQSLLGSAVMPSNPARIIRDLLQDGIPSLRPVRIVSQEAYRVCSR